MSPIYEGNPVPPVSDPALLDYYKLPVVPTACFLIIVALLIITMVIVSKKRRNSST